MRWTKKTCALALATLTLLSCDSSEPGIDFNFNQDLIAFRSDRDSNDEIYLITPDGSEFINITKNPADDDDPAWSPDGNKIAFASKREGGQFDIYVMNVDGSNLTRLTSDPAADTDPSWCQNGTRITFRSTRDGNSEIYIMDADGSNKIRLTNDPAVDNEPICGSGSPGAPCSKVVFYSNRSGNGDIWIMDPNNPLPEQISTYDGFDCSPTFSSDCLELLMVSDRGGSDDIYKYPLDGSEPTLLVGGSGDEFQASYSGSGGTHVVFDTNRDGNWELYTIGADGSSLSRLTSNPGADQLPVWRP